MSRRRGVTVVELLLALVLMGLVVGVAVRVTWQGWRSFTSNTDLAAALGAARFALDVVEGDLMRSDYLWSSDTQRRWTLTRTFASYTVQTGSAFASARGSSEVVEYAVERRKDGTRALTRQGKPVRIGLVRDMTIVTGSRPGEFVVEVVARSTGGRRTIRLRRRLGLAALQQRVYFRRAGVIP